MGGQDGSGSVRDFFGYALMTVGWLIAGTTGLCTTVVVGVGLLSITPETAANTFSYAPIPLLFGGIPILAGVAMIYAGRYLLRSGKAQEKHPP
jgi:hypothetical protein